MKLTSIFLAILLSFALVACGTPSAPEDAYQADYGTTHEGEPAVGRNPLPED